MKRPKKRQKQLKKIETQNEVVKSESTKNLSPIVIAQDSRASSTEFTYFSFLPSIFKQNNIPFWRVALGIFAAMLLGLLLRVFMIHSAPVGALIDEAHFGYIAYSLLQTGKDEHGISWPIIFKGFGDQKLPAYGYSLLPVVATLGLSNVTIRIPSIMAGTVLILMMYLSVRRILRSHVLGLFAAFLTALSPWSFFLSRFGFESNLALGFFSIGLWAMFQSAYDKRLRWLLIAVTTFGLTWYSYVAYRPVTVILLVVFFGYQWLQKQLSVKQLGMLMIVFAITVFPLFLPSAVGSNTARFKQVGIFSDGGMVQAINEKRTFCDVLLPRKVCYIFWNKPVVIASQLLQRYLAVYSPQYMATLGEDGVIFLTVEGFGQIYPILYPFFLVGFFGLLTRRKEFEIPESLRYLLLTGLLFSPLPTILVGDPQKVRMSIMLPFVFIAIVIGVVIVLRLLSKSFYQKAVFAIVTGGMLIASVFFFVTYFAFHVSKNDYYYQSYVPELMQYLHTTNGETTVYIKPFFSDPLMFYAYYTHMNPAEYQKLAELGPLEESGFQHTIGLGRFKVKDESLFNIACEAARQNQKTYFVSNVSEPVGKPLKELRSANKSLIYATIYDALQVGQELGGQCPKPS